MGRLVILFIFCFSIFSCKSKIQEYLNNEYKDRIGNPEIFKIDGVSFSAENFKKNLFFSRRLFEHKFTEPNPDEVEQYLSNYMEETMLLKKAIDETDFDSKEASIYMRRALREAAINYWLDKKSGTYDLVQNIDSIKIESSLAENYQKKSKTLSNFTTKEIQAEGKLIKIQKMFESAQLKKRLIVGKTKRESKIQIVPKEIYSPIQN